MYVEYKESYGNGILTSVQWGIIKYTIEGKQQDV